MLWPQMTDGGGQNTDPVHGLQYLGGLPILHGLPFN